MKYYSRIKKVKCEKCGEEAEAIIDIILTSYPPKYNVDCPNCGRVYMFCSDVNNQPGEIINKEYDRI